ncbi:type I phosphomannose isomerase catalytic subunit [Psychroflexus sp. MBR-150]
MSKKSNLKPKLYPLKFKPILKEKIWGGHHLNYKDSSIAKNTKIGESWEISGVEDSISVVDNGDLKGQKLKAILADYKEQLVGHSAYKRFGNEFPLLIKFIDAKDNLSVQLHPDDKIAKAKHNCLGKTEMWYIIEAEKDGFIIADFNRKMNREEYFKAVENKTIKDVLNHIKVKSGDVFFIAPGLIHAIGSGVLLAEIQQTSDITYRIYDWDRVDDQGNSRELHQQEALEAIDFTYRESKVKYDKITNSPNEVVHNEHFKTDYLKVENRLNLDLTKYDSFTILMNVGKDAKLYYNENTFTFNAKETYLIPASISNISIEAKQTEVLRVHI